MRNFKILLVLASILLTVIFVVQNAFSVEVSFIYWSYSLPLALLIIGNIILGILIGMFLKVTKKKEVIKPNEEKPVNKSLEDKEEPKESINKN